jgi:chromosome segregation ATPase
VAENLDKRLEEAIKRRDTLAAGVQRVEGKKEAAEAALVAVEDEIRAKNLDPDTLSESITQLEEALQAEVSQFEADLESAETSLSPYLKDQS